MPRTRLKDYCGLATQYSEDVISGRIAACEWVRSACKRQLDDLRRKNWTWQFDTVRANRICAFIELLPHVKGTWTSKTIKLEPWQCFVLTTIFGWVDAEGLRRFRKALIVVPRKNAKSTIAAAVGLYLLALDGEPGAEIFSAATTRDQAKVCWSVARLMAMRSPEFQSTYGVDPLAQSIVIENQAAFFRPLSRDADSLEGLNAHGAIIDELHAHKTREVFDVLDEATGARRQPLLFIISTEGDNSTGVLAEQVNYAQTILNRQHDDESYFATIYTLDKEDDWTQRSSWKKANPNYGVSVFERDLETRFLQAQKNPESQPSFLTKRLNVRVGTEDAYFGMLAWRNLCKDTSLQIANFHGKECYIGLDLASKQDVAAKVIVIPSGKEIVVFGRYYMPEDRLDRGHPHYDVYRGWANSGLLQLTPGNITDYEFIERDLLDDWRDFAVQKVGYDPHQATQFVTRMAGHGLPMVEIPQNVIRMSEPMKELGARISAGRVKHDGDKALDWMMGNVRAKIDAKENIFPNKSRNENKIDGAVALMIALGLHLRDADAASVYSNPATAIM